MKLELCTAELIIFPDFHFTDEEVDGQRKEMACGSGSVKGNVCLSPNV